MFIVPRQLLLTQWFFFVHPHEISSCACIAQLSKDTGCPRNYTCHRLLKVIFEFLNCYAWILLFWPGCGKCFEAKNLGIHSQILGNLFPFSQGLQFCAVCCPTSRTVVSYILSSVLVGYGGRASPKPVTPSWPERTFRNARLCII